MAEKNIYQHLNGNGNELRNWSGEKLAADPTGGDLYAGRMWFNTTDNKLRFYDGTTVQTVVTAEDLASIGEFQGGFDASAGVPTTTLDGDTIRAGDYWRVTVPGTISGIGGDDVLEVGDLVYALADGASTAAQFTAVQANLNLGSNLAQVEEVTIGTLPANTATAVPTTLTNVYSIQVFDSTNMEIGVCIAGPTTAPTIESSVALTGVLVRVVGN